VIDARRMMRDLDWPLLLGTLALACIGVAFIDSAKATADGSLAPEAFRQIVALGIAIVAMVVVLRIDYRKLAVLAPWAYGLGIVLLLLVFSPLGTEIGGNRAWLRLGSFSLQPSEPMKVATVLMLAVAAGKRDQKLRLGDMAAQIAVVALPVGILVFQDQGTALTFLPLLAASIFVSGLRWRWIVAASIALALLAPVGWNALKPYQQERIRVVFNPDLDPSGHGYHAIQSRITVGSGGFFGRGYKDGPQNRLGFLPERYTDFIFAIIAEEWGFVGAAAVLGLYLLLLRRLCDAAILAKDRLGSILCIGAMTFLGVHLVVNVGMVLGLLPTIGIPLPLLSYGGSSLLAFFVLIGFGANVRMRRMERA
jgi:rod shape determining protein RodA